MLESDVLFVIVARFRHLVAVCSRQYLSGSGRSGRVVAGGARRWSGAVRPDVVADVVYALNSPSLFISQNHAVCAVGVGVKEVPYISSSLAAASLPSLMLLHDIIIAKKPCRRHN